MARTQATRSTGSPSAEKKIRVLVVDDSALMRKLITVLIDRDPALEVVGTANDAYQAREAIKDLNPDVITLDVGMPGMNGIKFLENLMRLRPMPVVMVSAFTREGAQETFDALALGAIDFVSKPEVDQESAIEMFGRDMARKLIGAASARLAALTQSVDSAPKNTVPEETASLCAPADLLIAIGASTGGTEAIRKVMRELPPNLPGIVITQHIPAAFSGSFASNVDRSSAISVCEAEDGMIVRPGHAYIAPGDKHLEVHKRGDHYMCRLTDEGRVNWHKPSVEVLFNSVAAAAGNDAIGVMLTGMGKDGAGGMKRLRDAGAATAAQDQETSVIWGMPQAAIKAGGVQEILPLQDMAGFIVKRVFGRD